MHFEQFYLGCLAHASYLVGSEGLGAVVDPQRDIDIYLEAARKADLEIRYVIKTHLHADFVSGHIELAGRTGAEIVFGKRCDAAFPFRAVSDGDTIGLGTTMLQFLETPGHTPESISMLVIDTEAGPLPQKVLTGDTLFIGDVGRPDLVGSKGYSADEMAGMLYDSLHDKLLLLDDTVEVYPAHGAGSMCGRNISQARASTIGEQRRFNYALKPMPREEFIRIMTAELPQVPSYFPRDAELNRVGAAPLDELPKPSQLEPAALDLDSDFILDVRSAAAFGTAHIPGAINIALGGQFASWCGTLIPSDRPIVVVSDNNEEIDETILRLARVGIENVRGYLSGGIYTWDKAGRAIETLEQIPADELESRIDEPGNLQLVDVRRRAEFDQGHVPTAVNLPLDDLGKGIEELDPHRAVAVMCKSGYRSAAAASLLAAAGFQVTNVVGGLDAWVSNGYAIDTEGA
jgi:hydroxyacylglutathione hydrolase